MRTSTSTSITGIDSTAWDALDAGGSPFLRHAFLSSLEKTGCVGTGTGWIPAPITLHDERAREACSGVRQHRVQRRPVAQVQVPVVGPREAERIAHDGVLAADARVPRSGSVRPQSSSSRSASV